MISYCTPSLKHGTKRVDYGDSEKLYCDFNGVGPARRWLAEHAKGEVIVMVDDDITFNDARSQLTSLVKTLEAGEFRMATVDNHVSSRLFIIHKKDYLKTSGFDNRIRYVFEDGAFYLEALACGLSFKPIPNSLYQHTPHKNRTGDKRWVKSWWEHSRMLVKYKRNVYHNIIGFYGLRSLLKQPHVFFIKIVATIYYIIKGA